MNYLGIDLGGTKTLVAVFDGLGSILAQKKFPTSNNYEIFLKDVEKTVADLSTNTNISCCVATPGLIDRETGTVLSFGNLGWKNKPLQDDISKITGNIPTLIENDARTAGVAEASQIPGYKNVLYLTISTGIGGAFLYEGHIVKELQDSEMGHMPLTYDGTVRTWESFASGKAIFKHYGKKASEIDDPRAWQEIGERIGYGVSVCCSILQPEAIVFGGGVGQYAHKFINHVDNYLTVLDSLVKRPKVLLPAKFDANSAIHGCFFLLKQKGLVKSENS